VLWETGQFEEARPYFDEAAEKRHSATEPGQQRYQGDGKEAPRQVASGGLCPSSGRLIFFASPHVSGTGT
jgi:hypothetical protein